MSEHAHSKIIEGGKRHFEDSVLKHSLRVLGLNDLEAEVFLTLLSMGSQPASVIAREGGLNRAYCYEVLSSLQRKGFLDVVEKNGVKNFSTLAPQAIVEQLQFREEEFSSNRTKLASILPDLMLRIASGGSTVSVKTYDGLSGIRALFDAILKPGMCALVGFADAKVNASLSGPRQLSAWRRSFRFRRRQFGVWQRYILLTSLEKKPSISTDEDARIETRYLFGPTLPVEILACGDFVGLASVEPVPFGILVENSAAATSIRSLHAAVSLLCG